MKNLFILVISILAFTFCQSKKEEEAYDSVAVADYAMAAPAVAESRMNDKEVSADETIQKQIIKTADLRFQVKDFKESGQKINDLVKAYGGYVVSSNESNNNYNLEGSFTIRVKADSLDSFVDKLLGFGIYTDYKNVYTQDVTEEYIDITARLNNKKEVELKFKELLKKANNVKDILEIENNLRVIREEIDASEGRLKYIQSQVAMSSVNLNYYQKIEYYNQEQEQGFFAKLFDSVFVGWSLFLDFIVGLAGLWPFIIVTVVAAYLIKKWLKKRKNKQ